MRRREFVKGSALAFGSLLVTKPFRSFAVAESIPDPAVKRVLVAFKCHFDAGFIDTQAAVVSRYFKKYFPQAINVAEKCRQSGKEHYVWTTGSWLLYEYLEQASVGERRRMEQAIGRGDIAWHAIPFSWQTEVMSPSEISASIALSHSGPPFRKGHHRRKDDRCSRAYARDHCSPSHRRCQVSGHRRE